MKKAHERLILLTLFLVFSNGAQAQDKFGQTVPQTLETKVNEARQMRLPYNKENYDPEQSVKVLEEAVAEKPQYYRAHFNLGLAYHELGDYENSVAAFNEALKIREAENIDDATLLNTAGWVSLRNGDYERAETLLKSAVEETEGSGSSTEGAAHSNLGQVYFLTQRFDKAERHLTYARDEFGSKDAARYLDLLAKTERVLIQQEKIQMRRKSN